MVVCPPPPAPHLPPSTPPPQLGDLAWAYGKLLHRHEALMAAIAGRLREPGHGAGGPVVAGVACVGWGRCFVLLFRGEDPTPPFNPRR